MALSFEQTGKYTSERHQEAKEAGKLTAGEAAKKISKAVNEKVLAKDIKQFAREWHHSGFYAKGMGRTYFFTSDEVEKIIADWPKYQQKIIADKVEIERKKNTVLFGFSYSWKFDYKGSRGKKRNFKVLEFIKCSELTKPKNFTELTEKEFSDFQHHEGRQYFGWDEPTYEEIISLPTIEETKKAIQEAKHQKKLARRRQLYKEKKEKEKAEKQRAEMLAELENFGDDSMKILTAFFQNETHPAPAKVAEIKRKSGLSWNQLRDKFLTKKSDF